jgi:hypothetical protein
MLLKRVEALETKVEALETKAEVWPEHMGVYEQGVHYRKGAMVTWRGSTWTALEPTTAKPGDPEVASRAWHLSAKAGRDGRDLR